MNLWEHFQALADDIDLDIATIVDTLPVRLAAGSVSVTVTAAVNGFTAITFPTDRFTVAPLVVATVTTAAGGTQKFVPRVLNSTTTGADVYIYTGDNTAQTGTVTVAWLAIQMTASTAAG